MQNLATILDSQGHLREAEDLLERSLSIQKDLAGETSPGGWVAYVCMYIHVVYTCYHWLNINVYAL